MLAQYLLEPFAAVAAQHGPELQRAEAAAERRPVVGEGVRVVVGAQVLRRERERRPQLVGARRPEERAVHRRHQPLVRVDDERVGELDAILRRPLLLADPGRARVRRVDVEPRAGRMRKACKLAHRIDRGERRRADSRNHRGHVAELQPVGAHAERFVRPDLPQLHPEHPRRLLDGRVRVLGADDDIASGDVPRRNERGKCRRRRGVLDVSVPAVGQPEQPAHPVDGANLQLGRRRGCAPDQRDLVERRREQLREDPGLGCGDREVGEEARVLPVRQGGDDQLVEVAQHVRERLRLLRRRERQLRRQLARLHLREHRQLVDALEIARRPLDRRRSVLAKVAHGRFRRIFSSCFHVRVFTTSSFVSQPRRAWPIPSST